MKQSIDLNEDAVYIVKDECITKVSSKQFGQDVITWRDGKVWDIDRAEKVRIQGQGVV